jgi:DNA-binding CsgD family transcriptional regulator/PAS domain-containing protein
MAKRSAAASTRSVMVLFKTSDVVHAAATFLKSRTSAKIVLLTAATTEPQESCEVVRMRTVRELSAWLRSPGARPVPTTFVLGTGSEFDIRQQTMDGLATMRIRLPHLLAAGQDQVFVLDRGLRMVAFFGQWPKHAPWTPQELLGKRKRDVLGPELGALHEAAGQRALNGEDVAYEWSLVDVPIPVHLYTAASPLRTDEGDVAGVLLVTRDITRLKRAQIATEQALQQKTSQLLEVERGLRDVVSNLFQQTCRARTAPVSTGDRPSAAFLSQRERQVLGLLCQGLRVRSIAQTLGISVETVRRHLKAMFRKTGVHSQEGLIRLFARTVTGA